MAFGSTALARGVGKQGPHALLGVRTWLGIGAVTVGVGAALAASAAVAQADTSDHHATTARSASKDAAGPSSPARSGPATRPPSFVNVASPVAAVQHVPIATGGASRTTSTRVAGSVPTAATTTQTSQTIPTPFGPIAVTASLDLPDVGTSGPVSVGVTATTPIGAANVALAGQQTFTTVPSIVNEIAITGGTLNMPAPLAFLVSAVGSAASGAVSVYNSATSFVTALQSGNLLGAAQTFFTAASQFTNALLFGQQKLALPFDLGNGQSATLSIPFGGYFAPLAPVTLTSPGFSYIDQVTGAKFTIDAADISFTGTQFGGVGPALLQMFGV